MMLSSSTWEKLLARWCGMATTGEVKFICAALARTIVEEIRHAALYDHIFGTSRGFRKKFISLCRSIALDPDFVTEQVHRANNYVEEIAA